MAIRRKELGAKCLELRKEGLGIRAIAKNLTDKGSKVSKSEVQRLLAKELSELGASIETKREVRALQLDRLDTWLEAIFRRTKKGDEKAIATALKIEERRSKLLGTEAPIEQRVKLNVLGQLNWVFDMIEKELGPDAVKRVLRRISEESGAATAGEAGGLDPEA
jgi:hypothetical protein